MDTERFNQIEQVIRHEMSAKQCVRIELAAQETNAQQAVAALLGEKAIMLGKSRLCPICGASGAVKNGHDRCGLQRFTCHNPECGCHFTAIPGTHLSGMRMPDKWIAFVDSLAEQRSLDWVKQHLGISRKTGFAWRKRFLGSADEIPADMLGGIVEADETYFVRSFKGHRGWKTGHPPENRPPRYCGSGAVSRGLSSEQVPVVTALDRNGRVVQGVLSERSDTKILEMLAGRIEVRSVICSDGQSSYPKVAQACSGEHRTIERPVHTQDDKARGLTRGRPGALGLGRVNAYHQTLKTSINRIFRGVSTRFLPNYLALAKHLRGTAPAFGFIRAALA